MANPVPSTIAEVSNPDSWDSKKNKLRVFAMHILNALGIELLGIRMKNVADAFVPQEQNAAANLSHIQQGSVDESTHIVPPELDLLDKLFEAVKEVITTAILTAKKAAHQSIKQAVSRGQVTAKTAEAVHSAIKEIYTEEYIEDIMVNASKPTPVLSEKELEDFDEVVRDNIRQANKDSHNIKESEKPSPAECMHRDETQKSLIALAKILRQMQHQQRAERQAFRDAFITQVHPHVGKVFFDNIQRNVQFHFSQPEFSPFVDRFSFGTFNLRPMLGRDKKIEEFPSAFMQQGSR